MRAAFPPVSGERFDWLRRSSLLLLGVLPAAMLLSRGAAEIIVGLIGLAFVVSTVAEKRWDRLTELTVAVLIVTWVLLNVAVSPFAFDPASSFSRSLPWVRFVLFFAATITWLIRSRDDLKFLLIFWSAILAMVLADGYVQLISGTSLSGHAMMGNRLTGPLDRPNIGIFVTRIGFPLLAIALLLAGETRRRTYFIAVAIAAAAAGVFVLLTGERTAAALTLLGALSISAVLIFFMPRQRVYGMLMAAAVPAGLLAVFSLSDTVRVRTVELLSVVENFWSSVYGKIFSVAIRLWEQHPIAGVGLKNFADACHASLPDVDRCYRHAHNIYLEWLSEAGLIGFVCLLAFIAAVSFPVLRVTLIADKRLVGAALIAGLIVTLFPFAATQSFFSNWPALVMWSSLAVLAATTRIALQTHQQTLPEMVAEPVPPVEMPG